MCNNKNYYTYFRCEIFFIQPFGEFVTKEATGVNSQNYNTKVNGTETRPIREGSQVNMYKKPK